MADIWSAEASLAAAPVGSPMPVPVALPLALDHLHQIGNRLVIDGTFRSREVVEQERAREVMEEGCEVAVGERVARIRGDIERHIEWYEVRCGV